MGRLPPENSNLFFIFVGKMIEIEWVNVSFANE
jgi:hypothetical protein